MWTLMALSGLSAIDASLLTTLPVPKILLPMVNITVPFLSVKVPKFLSIVLLSSYDFFFWGGGGSRMVNNKDKDKEDWKRKSHKMSKVRARNNGYSHCGGKLKSWDEPNIQATLAEYNQ